MVAPSRDLPPPPIGSTRPVEPRLPELLAGTPIVLLPVRVETRWFATDTEGQLELRVRVFPDEIHVIEELEPTELEREEVGDYWQARSREGEESEAAQTRWSRLAERCGPGRAAWLVRTLAPGEPAFEAPRDAHLARALPDRWHVILRGAGIRQVAVGRPISRHLAVAPTEGDEAAAPGTPSLGSVLAWVTDFRAAVEVGMGVTMRVPAADAARLEELIVLGVGSAETPPAGSQLLGDMLARHAVSSGASLLPAGTATNNTEETLAGLEGAPLIGESPDAAGDAARLMTALGVASTSLRDATAPASVGDQVARALHTILWPATWGHFLGSMVTVPAADIARGRELFIEHVRPQGPFPALRVRAQPYGILPATSLVRWPATQRGGRLAAFLHKLIARWEPQLSLVPRLVGSSDVDRDLVAVLRRSPTSVSFAVRHAVTRDTASVRTSGLGAAIAAAASAVERALESVRRAVALADLGLSGPAPVLDLVFDDDVLHVTVPLVAAPSASRLAPVAPPYLRAIAEASNEDLAAHRVAGAEPRTLLYLLARHSTIQVRASKADTLLATPVEVRDEHRVRAVVEPLWARLRRVRVESVFGDPLVTAHHAALRELASVPVGELERGAAAALDAASHRLDAWATALASERLSEIRRSTPAASYIGAWAWLEAPRPTSVAPQGGTFIHAPSLSQARSAAVLRAAYEAHREDDDGTTLALDISSDRVKRARSVLDAMRAGRSLGRLLGDLIERWLEVNDGASRIQPLREKYPSPDAGMTMPPVIDGWRAAQDWSDPLPSHPKDAGAAKMVLELVDAVADLLLADSVHGTVSGNPARAAAALDALERGEVMTPDPLFDRSSADGAHERWRVVLLLPERQGWPGPARPRAVAAPRIDAWAAALLGNPGAASIRAGNESRTVAELDLCALDVVALVSGGTPAALLELAAASLGVPVDRVTTTPELDTLVLRAAAISRLLRSCRTPVAGDLGETAIRTAADRQAVVRSAVDSLDVQARPLAAAALVGPGLAGDPLALSAALQALKARTTAQGGDAQREVLGDAVPDACRIDAPAELAAEDPVETYAWLCDLARVRPGIEALDLLAMVSPEQLGPAYRASIEGLQVVVFGAAGGSALEALVVDGWSEVAPAAEVTTGAAFQFDAPQARPPQSILIAVPPPATPWSLELLESIVAETIDLAKVRMLAPAQVHGQTLPATYIADDPDEITASTDLFLVSAILETVVTR